METSFIFNHTKITYNYMQFKTKSLRDHGSYITSENITWPDNLI